MDGILQRQVSNIEDELRCCGRVSAKVKHKGGLEMNKVFRRRRSVLGVTRPGSENAHTNSITAYDLPRQMGAALGSQDRRAQQLRYGLRPCPSCDTLAAG